MYMHAHTRISSRTKLLSSATSFFYYLLSKSIIKDDKFIPFSTEILIVKYGNGTTLYIIKLTHNSER